MITNQLLYQLSYKGTFFMALINKPCMVLAKKISFANSFYTKVEKTFSDIVLSIFFCYNINVWAKIIK